MLDRRRHNLVARALFRVRRTQNRNVVALCAAGREINLPGCAESLSAIISRAAVISFSAAKPLLCSEEGCRSIPSSCKAPFPPPLLKRESSRCCQINFLCRIHHYPLQFSVAGRKIDHISKRLTRQKTL